MHLLHHPIVLVVFALCFITYHGKTNAVFPIPPLLPLFPASAPPYDFFQFVLFSPYGFCCGNMNCRPELHYYLNGRCLKPGPVQPPALLTTHGLWPTNSGIPNSPVNCASGPFFNRREMTRNLMLIQSLYLSWPNLYQHKNEMDFWKEEYTKHGRCFSQTDYFSTAWHWWNEYKAATLGIQYGPNQIRDLESAIYRSTRAFPLLRCSNFRGFSYLKEVVICLDRYAQHPINCPTNTMATYCRTIVWYLA